MKSRVCPKAGDLAAFPVNGQHANNQIKSSAVAAICADCQFCNKKNEKSIKKLPAVGMFFCICFLRHCAFVRRWLES